MSTTTINNIVSNLSTQLADTLTSVLPNLFYIGLSIALVFFAYRFIRGTLGGRRR